MFQIETPIIINAAIDSLEGEVEEGMARRIKMDAEGLVHVTINI
jgi:hypothetical protein